MVQEAAGERAGEVAMNNIDEMDKEGATIDEKIDYHLKQKALLMDQLVILHQRIRYREEAIRALALKKSEALQFQLPAING